MEWIWLKMFGSLVLILGLIVGTMWLLKKFMSFSKPALGAGIAMEVAGVLHLGPRRSVYAVKAGGQVILLGVADHAITYLTQLSDVSASVPGTPASGQQTGIAAPFFGLLKEQFTRTAAVKDAPPVFAPQSVEPVKPSKTVSRKKATKPL